MNDSAVKTTPSERNTWGSRSSKKSKRKRRRNKLKYSNLKWKKYRRESNFTKPPKTVLPQLSNRKIMSNWYWSNYQKAVEWRDRQELAHWKACALALREENKYLLEIINQMRPGTCPKVSRTWETFRKRRDVQSTEVSASSVDDSPDAENPDEEEQGSDDDIEFEMSEEMIEFFRESMRHKENLKKLKEQESAKKVDEEIKQMKMNRLKRTAEMQLLYGEGASMIIGMETAVQLSYEKFCETKSPKYWPNIPFRL